MSEIGNFTEKSFWQRPEGKTGAIVVGAAAIGLLTFLWNYHAELVAMLADTTKAVALLVALGVMIAVLVSAETRRAADLLFKILMYKVTDQIIGIDPISSMKQYIEKLQKALTHMEEQIQMLEGQIRGLKEKIRENTGKIKNALKIAGQAKKQLERVDFNESLQQRQVRMAQIIHQNTAVRKSESNKTYEELLRDAERVRDKLIAIRDGSMLLVEDMRGEVEELTERHKMSAPMFKVIKAAMKVKGATSDRAIYDRAAEMTKERYARAVGAVEGFTRLNADFLANSDLKNGIYEETALKMLEELERNQSGDLDSVINRDGISQAVAHASPASVVQAGKYDLFQ